MDVVQRQQFRENDFEQLFNRKYLRDINDGNDYSLWLMVLHFHWNLLKY